MEISSVMVFDDPSRELNFSICCVSSITVSKLLMRSPLTNLLEPKPLQNGNSFFRLQEYIDTVIACNDRLVRLTDQVKQLAEQSRQKIMSVLAVPEYPAPLNSPGYNMMQRTRRVYSGLSGHFV